MQHKIGSNNPATGGGLGAILLWSATFAFARSLSEQLGRLTAGAVGPAATVSLRTSFIGSKGP